MSEALPVRPVWDRLYETAAGQEGMFTTQQAAEAGYSPQLLVHYVRKGRAIRLLRGLYRLVHYPPGDHEDLVAAWLWSDRSGTVSHQTALSLHDLSDVLPARIHLTLPFEWRHRRLRVPEGITIHHAEVTPKERSWFGAVPTTSPRRSLNDCARAGLSPDLLRQGAQQAIGRGLVTKADLNDVEVALVPFGGIFG